MSKPEKVYNIVRHYLGGRNRIVRRGLTLEEAQAHCKDPETSSSTATKPEGKLRTLRYGAWFDGYTDRETRNPYPASRGV